MRSGCKKNERQCGAGCECRGCMNMQLSEEQSIDEDITDEDEEDTSSSENEEDIQTEIITHNFHIDVVL